VEHLDGEHGPAAFLAACRMGLEGIVSKRADSRYKSGACRSWLKVKHPAYERP
jgi:bifunctional non-homologous end joining protein LigD